jgi:hypothetical protein
MLTNWRFTGEILEFPGRGGGARRRQIQENAFESMALALRRFAIFAADGFAQALEIAGTSGLEDEEQFHQKLAITVNAS